MVAKIATGEIEEKTSRHYKARKESGKKGGKSRSATLPPKRKKEIASMAAAARWNKKLVKQTQG
jgi:hypothetical protein